MTQYATNADLIDAARKLIDHETTQADLAQRWDISRSYLCDFLQGRRGAGPAILKALGYEEKPYYRKRD